jgi:hypothetical protein
MKQRASTLAIATLFGALCVPALAQQSGNDTTTVVTDSSPGKATIAHSRRVVATVEAIDAQTRQVTLKGPKGGLLDMELGSDVRNLDQVKVGDRVVVHYVEALTLTLMKDGKEIRGRGETSDAVRTAPGQRPGGAAAAQIKVTADVIGVDHKHHVVTLRGPKQVVELHVVDPEQLKLIKVGDQIEATYTEALALSVEPAK